MKRKCTLPHVSHWGDADGTYLNAHLDTRLCKNQKYWGLCIVGHHSTEKERDSKQSDTVVFREAGLGDKLTVSNEGKYLNQDN